MRIAILVPAYNAASTIRETLQSIAAQNPDRLTQIDRVVVVDDASTDATREIVGQCVVDLGLKVELWPSDRNGGERTVVNRAFRRLSEEGIDWCFVLHADDVAKPNWLDLFLPELTNSSDRLISVCSSWDDWYPDRTVRGEDDPTKSTVVVSGGLETALGTIERGCWWHFSGCSMHLKRFWDVGGFCEDMPQLGDLEWLVRASMKGYCIRYLPRTLIKYRQTTSNVSSVSFRTNRDLKEYILICQRHGRSVGLEAAIRRFALQISSLAKRRAIRSLLHLQFSRARSAMSYWFTLRALAKNELPKDYDTR